MAPPSCVARLTPVGGPVGGLPASGAFCGGGYGAAVLRCSFDAGQRPGRRCLPHQGFCLAGSGAAVLWCSFDAGQRPGRRRLRIRAFVRRGVWRRRLAVLVRRRSAARSAALARIWAFALARIRAFVRRGGIAPPSLGARSPPVSGPVGRLPASGLFSGGGYDAAVLRCPFATGQRPGRRRLPASGPLSSEGYGSAVLRCSFDVGQRPGRRRLAASGPLSGEGYGAAVPWCSFDAGQRSGRRRLPHQDLCPAGGMAPPSCGARLPSVSSPVGGACLLQRLCPAGGIAPPSCGARSTPVSGPVGRLTASGPLPGGGYMAPPFCGARSPPVSGPVGGACPHQGLCPAGGIA